MDRVGGLGSRISVRASTFWRAVPWPRSDGAWSRKRLALSGSLAVVLLAGIGIGSFALSSGSSPPPTAPIIHHHPSHHRRPHRVRRRRRVVVHHVHHAVAASCPLTDLPPPGGHVPQREALAVKVGNNPSARPQSGLEDADIVFDTLAEGGITRYIAVFQCRDAPTIGPVRSVRWDDWHILEELGHAGLAFVGGIIPNQNTVASLKWICDLNDFLRPNLYNQDPNRVRPDATYTSTAALWSACPTGRPPPRLFHFSKSVQPGSSRVSEAEIVYNPYEADVVWIWSAKLGVFVHAFRVDGSVAPDFSASGARITASNVLIERVKVGYGSIPESPGATGDVESLTIGRGTAYLLRNGRLISGTWVRGQWAYLTRFVGPGGRTFMLEPGNTWVEIVPDGDPVTFTK